MLSKLKGNLILGLQQRYFNYKSIEIALIFNKTTKARNYTLETINKNIYIFGIAWTKRKKEVINEANKIYDVNKIYPSIYLVTE